MGDINQWTYIRRFSDQLAGPYLEVGSKDYGSTQDLRSLFAGRGRYLGVDLEDGPGVDLVVDLTADFDQIDRALEGARFGTAFCLSVLEHCRRPFEMAGNLTRLLRPGGKVCVSVPFSWKFHAYPDDYWRFTHQGVQALFARLEFDPRQTVAATSRANEFAPVDRDLGRVSFRTKPHWRKGHIVRGLSAKLLGTLAKAGIWKWFAGYPYVLLPTNILMIGTLRQG